MDAEAYADMLPWLVFLVIDRRSGLTVAWAAGCATLCSSGLFAWSYWRGRRAPLTVVGMAFFAPCYVAGMAFPLWNGAIGVSRSMAVLAISVAAFTSLRFTPISETYTTPLVAPGIPSRPGFRQVNLEMTTAWGVGSLLAAVVCAVSAIMSGTYAFTFMDWVIPLVVATGTILWAARRWELFRLSLDGTAELGAAAQHVPLRAYEPACRHEDAVIRELPVRDLPVRDLPVRDLPVRRSHKMLKRRTL